MSQRNLFAIQYIILNSVTKPDWRRE